ncbi:MAG: hypothetical protein HYU67_11815 [Flavobacteriia bacterium]|nr:hypothetical protein [Flavobacteriia bacterium]
MEDPDQSIYEHVRNQLKNVGRDAIPLLEESWESQDFGLLFQHRIEQIIHEIQFDLCKKELVEWKNSSEKSLLQGAIIIAKYQYPGIIEKQIFEFVEKIRKDIWLEINPNQTAFEKVKIFNHVFYELYGFSGDHKNFYSPDNSFINKVIERKKGNPLSLSILYSVIAQQLEIPIFGVNLPNHFVCCYMDENGINNLLNDNNKFGVFFYINSYSKGSIFYEKDIYSFLKQIDVYPDRSHFEPCSNTVIILRMISNLIGAYQQVANPEKIEELNELRSILENN